jgi:ABC-type uncharacterized transport system ATPase subunit
MPDQKEEQVDKLPTRAIKHGDTVLEARGITKRYPGIVANDHIDFDIKAGEIHAILGENGAGKTTLMKILFGLVQPDEGEIFVYGEKVKFKSPLDAIQLGIGMVHQNRKLIPAHSVIENIILGHPNAGNILDLKGSTLAITELCDKYGFKIDLKAKVWQLSEGEKQIVEILKALYRGARILILDEPTSALAPPETKKLLASIRIMTGDDLALVPFITHKLPIVLTTSDRVTVLRRGKVTARLETTNATENSLAKEMVGRDVIFRLEHEKVERGNPILQVEHLSAINDKGIQTLKDINFSLHAGEIIGIAGISGNGQQVLAEVLAGLRKPLGGKILMDGIDITSSSSLDKWQKGMGYIPSERVDVGSIRDYSIMDNIMMNYYFDHGFSKWGVLDSKKIRKLSEEIISEYGVVVPGPDTLAKSLSGGNLQKVILARVLSRKPRLIIANLPTQGLDVGAAEFVQNKLLEARREHTAILLISEDLDEVLSLSDRVAPIYEGEFMDIIPIEQVKREDIGLMMAGLKHKVAEK